MRIFLTLVFGAFLAAEGHAQSESSNAESPNSVIETYRDWTVRCVPRGEGRICQMVQELARANGGKRLLSFVVNVPKEDEKSTPATVLAPFGLRLASGVALSIDSAAQGNAFGFSTCVPQGCVAPVTLDEKLIDGMKSGQKLGLSMVSISSGQKINVELSLSGFTAAYNRLRAL